MIIDVSHHNGVIDWKKCGKIIDYAILRCGYGSNDKRNDDKQFNYNATQCEKYGIPYGVYIYSYARNMRNCVSETNHILRCVKNRNVVMPLYYDIEEADICNSDHINIKNFADSFVSEVRFRGYKGGIYSSDSIFNKKLYNVLCDSRWVARYNTAPPKTPYHIWQYTSKGDIDGVSTLVDMSVAYNHDYYSDDYYNDIVSDVLSGKYGNGAERKKKLYESGINYWKVQNMINVLYNM